MAAERVNYDCAVRGYHLYKSVWEPKERQILSCLHKENNIYNMFAIKTCLTDENGKKLDRGAAVTTKLTSTYYQRSVLAQRDLEVSSQVKAKIIAAEKNKCILVIISTL